MERVSRVVKRYQPTPFTPDDLDAIKRRSAENAAVEVPMTPEEERSKRIESIRQQSEIPDKFRMSILANYDPTSDNADAIAAARSFIERGFCAPAVGLCGPVGTGKTRLLCAIANAAIIAEKRSIVTTMGLLWLRLKDTWRMRDDSEYALMQRLVHTPVLAIDELGKEEIDRKSAPAFSAFFEMRYNSGLPVVVAANLTAKELWAKYSVAPEGVDPNLMLSVLDKIREMTGPWVNVGGKSRRRGAA